MKNLVGILLTLWSPVVMFTFFYQIAVDVDITLKGLIIGVLVSLTWYILIQITSRIVDKKWL